jgi:hypothetical protein
MEEKNVYQYDSKGKPSSIAIGTVKCDGNMFYCEKCKKGKGNWNFSTFLAKTGHPPRACGVCKDKLYWKKSRR